MLLGLIVSNKKEEKTKTKTLKNLFFLFLAYVGQNVFFLSFGANIRGARKKKNILFNYHRNNLKANINKYTCAVQHVCLKL